MPDITFLSDLEKKVVTGVVQAPVKKLWGVILWSGSIFFFVMCCIGTALYVYVSRDIERAATPSPTSVTIDRGDLQKIIEAIRQDDARYDSLISKKSQ